MKLTTVLFDFDGTLADTLPLTFHGLKSVFRTFDDRAMDNDDILSMFGPTEDGIIERHLQNRDKKRRRLSITMLSIKKIMPGLCLRTKRLKLY
ncbi:HAD hydrolase-like protein [Terrilactibacillus sp. S3-3]|nr:HAD hydrolase-like protein [Terrilactibacillus sp. S3-3]